MSRESIESIESNEFNELKNAFMRANIRFIPMSEIKKYTGKIDVESGGACDQLICQDNLNEKSIGKDHDMIDFHKWLEQMRILRSSKPMLIGSSALQLSSTERMQYEELQTACKIIIRKLHGGIDSYEKLMISFGEDMKLKAFDDNLSGAWREFCERVVKDLNNLSDIAKKRAAKNIKTTRKEVRSQMVELIFAKISSYHFLPLKKTIDEVEKITLSISTRVELTHSIWDIYFPSDILDSDAVSRICNEYHRNQSC